MKHCVILMASFLASFYPALKAQEESASGRVAVTVFEQGTPVEGATLIFDDNQKATTDATGGVILATQPGLHVVRIQQADNLFASTEFRVLADQLTQIIINQKPGQAPAFAIEEPDSSLSDRGAQDSAADRRPAVNFNGRVISMANREPIEGARVYVRGSPVEAVTDAEGRFKLDLYAGTFSLSLVHPKFSTLNVDQVQVEPSPEPRTFTLSPAGVKLDEYVVTAPHIKGSMASLLDERRQSAEVTDVIGAEQMAKSGDSDAASALRRVTGLTLVDGKYIYIRGLGGRYSSVLLNGFNLPSPNPLRREVPLDMFPTGVLESITVQKTYSADLPGDFAGGAVLLKTKSLPDDFFVKVGTSLSYQAGLGDGWTYAGGSRDWLGIDDGSRALPDDLDAALADTERLKRETIVDPSGFSDEQIEQFGESFSNTYDLQHKDLPPGIGLSLAIGDRAQFDGFTLGYLGSVLYGNEWDHEVRETAGYQLSAGEFIKDPAARREQTEHKIKTGVSLSLGSDIGSHTKLRTYLALLRKTVDQAAFEEGENSDYNAPYRFYLLEWEERELLMTQIWGEHTFAFLNQTTLSWRYGTTDARRYQPDTREYRRELLDAETQDWRLADRNDGNERRFGDLRDENRAFGVDLEVPFGDDGFRGSVKTGIENIRRNRDSDLRRFGFVIGPVGADVLRQPMSEIVSPEHISPTGLRLNEKTLDTDNYTASQTISAAYGIATSQLSDWLELSLGARREQSQQEVHTFDFENPQQAVVAELDEARVLPSFSSTLSFNDQLQWRLAYGKTLARPDFRELSSSEYIDEQTGRVVTGNPDLKMTEISAYDTRLEYYPSSNESASIGVFYKDFKNPIESTNQSGNRQTFINAQEATAYGLELDATISFWDHYTLAANYSYIVSEVNLGNRSGSGATDTSTSRQRPLQGQSPYVINFGLYYDHIGTDTQVSLLFNRFGPRISIAGDKGLPDEYEQPRNQLDLVFSQEFSDHYEIKFKAQDLLAEDQIYQEDDRVTFRKERYPTLSLGMTATF
jgi:outer membrane receptor protein involved in Fe transport